MQSACLLANNGAQLQLLLFQAAPGKIACAVAAAVAVFACVKWLTMWYSRVRLSLSGAMLSLSGAMLSLSGAILSAAGSTRVSHGSVLLGNSSAQNHSLTFSRALAPSRTSRLSQTALFRPLPRCCRVSTGSIQEQAGQVKQHSSDLSCCVTGAVQALAMSPDCALLATAAQDNTVFLFKVAGPTVYEPVGFFRLKQPASCMTWAPDSTKLLISCRLEQLLA